MDFCSFEKQVVEKVYNLEKTIFPDCYSINNLNNVAHDPLYKYSVVLKDNDCLVGYAIIYEVLGEAEIHRIAVSSEYRRMGYGEIILSKCIESLMNDNIEKLHLEVKSSNAIAISLYKKLGFELVGMRKNYYADNNDDALLYTLMLNGR